jgi:hypothetical protein
MAEATPFLLRASQAHMWVRCTAYASMTVHAVDLVDPVVRDQGICAHWASLMVWLGHRVNVGQRVQVDGMSSVVVVDDEMIDAIDEYLDEIRSWGGRQMLEYSVAAPRIHHACGGTCDAWSYDPQKKTLYVGDLKYGYRFVDVFGNWQLLVYVCGLLDHIGIVDDTEVTVVMAIYQPRSYRGGAGWRKWCVNASLLRTYFNILRNAADEYMSGRGACRTGEHCNNCDARITCDTFDAAVENAIDVVSEPINNLLTADRVDSELLRIERAYEVLEARKSALEARVEMYARNGVQLRHYEMKPGQSRRIWKEGMLPALQSLASTRNVELFKQKPITPTQAEKVIGKDLAQAMSERPPAGLKLAHFDDTKAARVFGQIIEG